MQHTHILLQSYVNNLLAGQFQFLKTGVGETGAPTLQFLLKSALWSLK